MICNIFPTISTRPYISLFQVDDVLIPHWTSVEQCVMVYSVFCKIYLMCFNKEVKNGLNSLDLEMINWKPVNSKNMLPA